MTATIPRKVKLVILNEYALLSVLPRKLLLTSAFIQLFDVIEFIFFLALVWCAQKMLSHMIGELVRSISFPLVDLE